MAPAQRRVRALVLLLGGGGVMHFVIPRQYARIVPPGFGDPMTMVKASGVAELACAGLLAHPATRRLGGLASLGLFVGVFPANVYTVRLAGENRLLRAAAIARLPLQLPMITAALRIARES